MKKRKGGFEIVPVIIVLSIMMLLIVVVAFYSSQIQLSGTLVGEVQESKRKFDAHATMAALRSNDKFMEKLRMYTVTGENEEYINSTVRELLSGYRVYSFRITNTDKDKTLLKLNSSSEGFYLSSWTYVASPSPDSFEMKLGVGKEVDQG